MVGTVFADVVVAEGSEELEDGDSSDKEEEVVASAVEAKEVSEGAGDEGGDESTDWEEGVLNGYGGTVGTVGIDRVGKGGTAGTVNGSELGNGSTVCARRTGALRLT